MSPRAGTRRGGRQFAVIALVVVACILATSVAVSIEVDGAPLPASPAATGTPIRPLSYSGRPPSSLAPLAVHRAGEGEPADLRFEWGASDGIPDRYFVPIVAMGAGIDALSSRDLQGLVDGRLTNWRDVNGVAGPVVFSAAGPGDDLDAVRRFTRDAKPRKTYETYAQLQAAMTPSSGIVAFVPLDEVDIHTTALAVDGIDLVRGRGDPSAWLYADTVAVRGLTERGTEIAPRLTSRIQAKVPRATTVVATGDILLSRCTLARLQALGDYTASFKGAVADYLRSADLTLASLDGSIQDVSPPFGCVPVTNLTSPPQVLPGLTLAGIDEVTVATNHVFDCGQLPCGDRAFLRTLDLLKQANIKVVGGGKNLEEALAPATFEVNGVTFGVLGFDDVDAMELEATATEPGTAPLDDDYSEERRAGEPAFFRPASELEVTRFVDRIQKLKREVDVVIVQVQSGTEDTHQPTERSIKAIRAAADAGADLVIGNQAHWVQAVETRGNAYLAYALGNFVFDQVQTREHTEGYLVEATFWGNRLTNVRLVPYHIAGQYHPEFLFGADRAKVLTDVFAASENLPPAR